jgi:hypothetical protein
METSAGEKLDPSELPFLVTHWLANFDTPTSESQDAVQRIRDAASEMASAFSQLGLFGTLHPVSSPPCPAGGKLESWKAPLSLVERAVLPVVFAFVEAA